MSEQSGAIVMMKDKFRFVSIFKFQKYQKKFYGSKKLIGNSQNR